MTPTKVNSFLSWLIQIRPLNYGNKLQRRDIIKQIKKQDKQKNIEQ